MNAFGDARVASQSYVRSTLTQPRTRMCSPCSVNRVNGTPRALGAKHSVGKINAGFIEFKWPPRYFAEYSKRSLLGMIRARFVAARRLRVTQVLGARSNGENVSADNYRLNAPTITRAIHRVNERRLFARAARCESIFARRTKLARKGGESPRLGHASCAEIKAGFISIINRNARRGVARGSAAAVAAATVVCCDNG